ncbi:ABC transporter substrate-binding protein [Nocardioides zeae]|uniref:ABC transporter substrate-binding protein n=1 Tax=Nocardioides imazamoxiresistens TaxID=3231893 RepID=A0ABU3PU81_9ACTN|nr:ABC transporter substrate-binding protein [Nocardioides zeae]MDT9592739.1 ABC transporter substrate-binding protein [Nocardioides zeae]
MSSPALTRRGSRSTRAPRDVRPTLTTAFVALTLALTVAACGLDGVGAGDDGHGDAAGPVAPPVAEVTPLEDVRSWEGEVSAVLPERPVDPVADPTPELPVTLTDAQGTEVTVTDVSRVLALDVYGTLSRTVFELGLGENLVGRDVSTQFPEAEELELVTQNGHDLNAEAVLELDPTVIVTDTSLGPWDVLLQMRDSGIPVVVVDSHRGLDNVASLTEQVATALGVPGAGAELAERIETEVAAVQDDIAEVAPSDDGRRLRTVFLYVRGASGIYYMFGEGSGADSLIEAIGAYDVAGEIGWTGMKPLTDEGLIAAQPDLVLMMSGGLESAGGVDGLLERLPALAATPAGENRRFVDMADAQILGYGPLTADVLNALAVAVYAPEAIS